MSDGLAMATIDSRPETGNAPPSVMQPFTNKAPPFRGAGYNQLSEGAKNFVKEFLPEDDNQDVIVTFELVKEEKPFKSKILRDKAEVEGREPGSECDVFEDVVYIRKTVAGNSLLEVHRPKYASDEREFPYAWQEFKRGSGEAARGTSLTNLGIDKSAIRILSAHNIFCIEDMARVTDTWIPTLGTGAREWRRRAIDYLRVNRVEASPAMDEIKATAAKQQAQLDQALELLAKLSAENEALRAAKPKLGRPVTVKTE